MFTPTFTTKSTHALNSAFSSHRRSISYQSSVLVAPLTLPVASITVGQDLVNCAWQSLGYAQACANISLHNFGKQIKPIIDLASTQGLLDEDIEIREHAISQLKKGYKNLNWGVPTIDEVESAVDKYGAARFKGLGLTVPNTRFSPSSFHCVVVKNVLTIDGKKFF
jgi:hypothetical protein